MSQAGKPSKLTDANIRNPPPGHYAAPTPHSGNIPPISSSTTALQSDDYSSMSAKLQKSSTQAPPLTLLYHNVKGLPSKGLVFLNALLKLRPTFFCLAETMLSKPWKSTLLTNEYHLKEVLGLKMQSHGRPSGGLIVGLRKSDSQNFLLIDESQHMIIYKQKNINLHIMSAYLPPDNMFDLNATTLFAKAAELTKSGGRLIVIGDLNGRIGVNDVSEPSTRTSRDTTTNTRGNILLNLIAEAGKSLMGTLKVTDLVSLLLFMTQITERAQWI